MTNYTLTVRLADDQAEYVRALIESGRYEDGSDVVRAGLTALQEQDKGLEQWLREDVVPTAEALEADPSSALELDDVFDEIRAIHAARTRG